MASTHAHDQQLRPDPGEPKDLRVRVSPGAAPVVAIGGELDSYSAPAVREELLHVLGRRGPRLVIDLSGVTFLDCAGISALLATRRRAQLEGGSVRLIQVPVRARRVIELTGLAAALGLSR